MKRSDGINRLFLFCFILASWVLSGGPADFAVAQENSLEITLDFNANTIPLPKILRPDVDLSGRGFSRQGIWPQELAAQEVLDTWRKDIGFQGVFRLQYNLWEINEFAKNNYLQKKLMANYENILQQITDAGGVAIVTVFGTPAGLGRVLDKKSPPLELKAFKELVKENIRYLSIEKKYNIWYEVWRAPDLDEFFLGRKQDYFNIYRVVAEAVIELEKEYKVQIPVGGPSSSWWFQNFEGNTIVTPERSLIYELIRFCFHYHLPIDFISWHAYSTDPKAEKEITAYHKNPVKLIKAWLSYFHFKKDIPLIIDEWNYDSGANVLPARGEKAHISASYVPARLLNMYEAGVDYQVYFSLEDFQNNKENVTSNVGLFWFDSESAGYKGQPKNVYNVFRMLNLLGKNFFSGAKIENEFVGGIFSKDKEGNIYMLLYNYLDSRISLNYLSRNIGGLKGAERRVIMDLVRSGRLNDLLEDGAKIAQLRTTGRVKALLEKARQLDLEGKKFKELPRQVKVNVKNLSGQFFYQKYTVDSGCLMNCKFAPVEEKEVELKEAYQEIFTLDPYSVQLVVFKKKPKEIIISAPPAKAKETPPAQIETVSLNQATGK
jgi:hypothetical protein